jgi:hypothetical protein
MMTGFERVLCPVDESEFSARALRYAVALANVYRAESDADDGRRDRRQVQGALGNRL